jgi:putative transposase
MNINLKYQFEVYPQVLQDVLKRLDKNFKNFFHGNGYPRFKSRNRNRYNSFTYPQSGFKIEDSKLHLSKIGSIKIVQHREIEGKVRPVRLREM